MKAARTQRRVGIIRPCFRSRVRRRGMGRLEASAEPPFSLSRGCRVGGQKRLSQCRCCPRRRACSCSNIAIIRLQVRDGAAGLCEDIVILSGMSFFFIFWLLVDDAN